MAWGPAACTHLHTARALPLLPHGAAPAPWSQTGHNMKLTKVTAYVCIAVFFVSMAFIVRYVRAQKIENVEWLGWIEVAKPSTSPDPRIHMKKTYDAFVREDIEVGLRDDGV